MPSGPSDTSSQAPPPPDRADAAAAAAAARDRRLLKALLRERNQSPQRAAEIDRTIRQTFERQAAVLVLDMCGFSRLTAAHGILFYLAMIAQMEDAARPAVANNGGVTFKQDADNLFAVFPTSRQALEGALDVFLAFDAVNGVLPAERHIQGSIGIGYGPLLVVEASDGGEVEDVFGHEMNLASRLGEDLACGSEVLLTPAAFEALPPGRYALEPSRLEHRGAEVLCHRFLKKC